MKTKKTLKKLKMKNKQKMKMKMKMKMKNLIKKNYKQILIFYRINKQ